MKSIFYLKFLNKNNLHLTILQVAPTALDYCDHRFTTNSAAPTECKIVTTWNFGYYKIRFWFVSL